MVSEKLKLIFCDYFEIDEEDFTPDARFKEDFGFDELDFADLAMDVEDVFQIELSDEALERISTIADLTKYVEENI